MLEELFASWLKVLTRPTVEALEEEKKRASATKLLVALLLAGLAAGLATVPFEGGPVATLLNIGTAMVTFAVDGVVIAFILFVVAKIVGGEGDFLTHCYLLSLPAVPLTVIGFLFGRAVVLAAVLRPLAPLGLERIIPMLLGVYGFFIMLLAFQAAHNLSASQAIRATLIAGAIWVALDVVAIFVSGADNVLTRTVRFISTHTDNLVEQTISHAWLVIFSMLIAIVLGVVIGILITLPSRRPRISHLLALLPLGLSLFVYLGGGGVLGSSVEQLLEFLPKAQGFGLIGLVLVVLLYVLFLFGEGAAEPVLYAAGVMLTFPSIGLFGLFIPLFGIGFMNAAVALILYAQLPILRNTYTGIKEVPSAIIEAGRGMGMTEWQILYKVKLPMTVPVIMAGVRVSMVMIVGIAAIAKLIGVTCLGKYIFDGLGQGSTVKVITGAVGVSIFALAVDGLLGWLEKAFTPVGLRERSA
ncbi:MAG: ABC transporter permease [Anaerolineae bacterium]